MLLTFDDGPHPQITPAVLECLARFEARALFFVVGNRIDRAPDLLARILERGHLLGNHSFAHPLDRKMSLREYAADLVRAQEEIHRRCGHRPLFHRPPLGRLSPATLLPPLRLGLTTVHWSRSSEDWRLRHQPDTIQAVRQAASNLGSTVQPRDIVLFHDESEPTVALLHQLLPTLRERGLRFDPAIHAIH
ncbi:MAG: polysaccharide deacetylase family protein [Pirellulales bacterium]